jgi:hypothetical protein
MTAAIAQTDSLVDWQRLHEKQIILAAIEARAEEARRGAHDALGQAIADIASTAAIAASATDPQPPTPDTQPPSAASPPAPGQRGSTRAACLAILELADGPMTAKEIAAKLIATDHPIAQGVDPKSLRVRVRASLVRGFTRHPQGGYIATLKAKAPPKPPSSRTAVCETCRRDFQCGAHGPKPKHCKRPDCAPPDASHRGEAPAVRL